MRRPLRVWLLLLIGAVCLLAWPEASKAARSTAPKPTPTAVKATPTKTPGGKTNKATPTPTTGSGLPVVKKGALAAVRYILHGLSVTPPKKPKQKGKLNQSLYSAYALQTAAKQKASINFADGTLLHLNQRTDAVLRSPSVTAVKQGEVEQIVVPGTHHNVQTSAGVASAVGTIFDVRMNKKKKLMTVIVVEGAVLVKDKKGSVVVKSGQETTVKLGKAPTPPKFVDAPSAVVWAMPIPPAPGPEPMNIALDANGGQVVEYSSQAAAPLPLHSHLRAGQTTATPWDARGINDGSLTTGWSSASGQNKAQFIKLSFGNLGTYPVSEVLIDPAATNGHPAANDLNDFTIRVSTTTSDEASFQTVFRGAASQGNTLQIFALPANTVAKYVELRAIDNYGGDSIDVAEFEVIAAGPAIVPSATATPTPTPTPTATPKPNSTATPTPTPTATPVPSATATGTSIPYTVTLGSDSTQLPSGAPANFNAAVSPAPPANSSLILQEVKTATAFRDQQSAGTPCPPGPTCTIAVSKDNNSAGTYTYTVVLQRSDGTILARSPTVTVTWTAFTVQSFSASATNVPLGTSVRFTAVLNQPLGKSTFIPYVAVLGSQQAPLNAACDGTTCTADVQATRPGSYTFGFVLLDTNQKLVLEDGAVTVYWQWTIQLSADQTTVPVGTTINLTATANADVSSSGYLIVFEASSGNSASCTTGSICAWQLTSSSPGSVNVEAYIVDSSNNAVAHSAVITLTWQQATQQWSISLDAKPTNPPFSGTSTLTATANQDVSTAGYHIRIEDAHNGYVYNQCSSGTTCSVDVPYTDVSGGTGCSVQGSGSCDYIAIVTDGQNIIAQSNVVTVTWQSGVAALARDAASAHRQRTQSGPTRASHATHINAKGHRRSRHLQPSRQQGFATSALSGAAPLLPPRLGPVWRTSPAYITPALLPSLTPPWLPSGQL